ncbi:MAG TPA: BTAD domain-containing putative transcriptional regulator [Candidatus Xenobia bacterium]
MAEGEETRTHVPATARIRVQEGALAGHVFADVPLPAVVGRSKQATVQLEADSTISRRHVLLALRGGRLAVQDLSTNGTRVGPDLLVPGQTVMVADQTPIWLGQKTMITVEVHWEQTTETAALIAMRTLGAAEVTVNGGLVPGTAWQTRKAIVLLAWLALHPGAHDPQRLCEAVWPESEGGTRATLHSTVSRIRKAMKTTDPFVLSGTLYSLMAVSIDAAEFEARCRGRRWEEAVALYGGPFLLGHAEEWVELHRTRLQRLYLEALEALSGQREKERRWDDAIRYYERMLACDACWEAAHVGLIRCLAATGQREAAVRQYQECSRLLKKHLDLPPGEELLALYCKLRSP